MKLGLGGACVCVYVCVSVQSVNESCKGRQRDSDGHKDSEEIVRTLISPLIWLVILRELES